MSKLFNRRRLGLAKSGRGAGMESPSLFPKALLISIASMFDFGGFLQPKLEDVLPWYDPDKTPEEMDAAALRSDWDAVRKDLEIWGL